VRRSLRRAVAVGAGLALCSAVLAACGGGTSSAAGTIGHADAAGNVWLCRPGSSPDPCDSSLDVTIVPGSGARTTRDVTVPARSAFDCFYVYPTVSTQSTDNANLRIQRAETDVAIDQASPFSRVCRVWAPMYRQRTVASLLKGLGNDKAADLVAFRSLLSAWKDYLTHFNDGRPVVFIGHSQGAAMLIRLLESQVDPSARLRARMVTAILLGGNVAVPTGKAVGSTFRHLALCTRPGETRCVVAFSTFPSEPPNDSDFGRPGQGVSLQSGQTATRGVQVACVNPAAIGGRTAPLSPLFRTSQEPLPAPAVTTPWVTFPALYTAACEHTGGATWLDVRDVAAPGDPRPVVAETLGPQWGYHAEDVNLTLDDLVADVLAQETTYVHAPASTESAGAAPRG